MLDLRLPIGWFFVINGALVIGQGLLAQAPPSKFGTELINLNLDWGLVLLGFGIFMLALGYMEKKKESTKEGVQKETANGGENIL